MPFNLAGMDLMNSQTFFQKSAHLPSKSVPSNSILTEMQFGPIAEEDEYEQQQVIGEDEGDEAEGEEEVGEEGEKIEEEVDGEKEENGEDEEKK